MADAQPKPWPVVSLAEANARLTAPGAPFEMGEREIRGVRTRVWKNALPTLRELFLQARAFGDRTFCVYEADRATFEGFARASLAIAHALQADGVRRGDRVAIAMRNLPEWPAAFYGAVLAGAIATPLNAWWTGPELEYALADSGAKVAIVDAERLQRLADHLHGCPGLTRIFASRLTAEVAHPLVRPLEDVTGAVNAWGALRDRPLPQVALDPDDDATLFYTSGTTGKPKGALGTHRNSMSTLMAYPYSAARTFVRRGEPVPPPDPNAPQKATLLSIPLFHTTGCQASLASAMSRGVKMVMARRFDPEQAFQLIERERINSAGGVPTIAWQLIEHPARTKYDLSSLESLSYGGAPAPAELVRRMREVFPNSVPATGWGMTETSATFTHHQGEDYQHRPDSCGPPIAVCEMEIRDADGRVLPPNAVGELWVKGPNVVKSYWNKPDATAEAFVDGWLRTGDVARLDEEGFCYIVDRAKDMLIRGGENIYCIEVEDVLYEHPAVMDVALVGIPHRTLGEQPGAVVCLCPSATATEEELRAHVAERLAAFKVPVRVLFQTEPLPRNPNGKIMKSELKKLFA
jgi:long-chain acyl-CoA synthetase